MSIYIVDASIAAKLFLVEEYADDALAVMEGDHRLHAPDFFLLEMDSIICKWIRRGVITASDGDQARAAVEEVPIKIYPSMSLRDSAYSIANQTRRSFYDCLYVALAVLLEGRMVTADRRLYEAVSDGPFTDHVRWVEDVS